MEIPVRFPSGNVVSMPAEEDYSLVLNRNFRPVDMPKYRPCDLTGWSFHQVVGWREWMAFRVHENAMEPEPEVQLSSFGIGA